MLGRHLDVLRAQKLRRIIVSLRPHCIGAAIRHLFLVLLYDLAVLTIFPLLPRTVSGNRLMANRDVFFFSYAPQYSVFSLSTSIRLSFYV